MLGFLCADPLFSTPPPLSPSVPEAPSLILPSVRFQSNDEAGCVWKYWIAKTSLGERVCEWTFQHRARPGPCTTDWWTTNGILCPERERKKEGTESGKRKEDRHREGGRRVLRFFRTLQSGALYPGLKYLITWLVWPLAPTQWMLSGSLQ